MVSALATVTVASVSGTPDNTLLKKIYIYIYICIFNIYIHVCNYVCIYIYIYREREREINGCVYFVSVKAKQPRLPSKYNSSTFLYFTLAAALFGPWTRARALASMAEHMGIKGNR